MERVGINSCKEDITNPLKYFNMELTFNKEQISSRGAVYVAEFEATSDFNLHIERKQAGGFRVHQKSVSDAGYAVIDNAAFRDNKLIIDVDFVGAVFPKYIKVESGSEPTMGVVTFNA